MHPPLSWLRRPALAAAVSFLRPWHWPLLVSAACAILVLTVVIAGGQAAAVQPLTGGSQPVFLVTIPPFEDLDGDGAFDVFEDRNRNHILDDGEDLDGDGRLTPRNGCEGRFREDRDCDGILDTIDEDYNHNGRLDYGEDRDGDFFLDDGTEDANGNGLLDDRPFPSFNDPFYDSYGNPDPIYPYEAIRPSSGGVTVSAVTSEGMACQCLTRSLLTPWLALVDDRDRDGAFDIYEDTISINGQLDPGEDRDGDGRLTPLGGCEGISREDRDCDGHLDWIDEDLNGNGIWEPELGEDVDGDRRYDDGTEDRNADRILNDRPFIFFDDTFTDENGRRNPFYPYGVSRPGLAGQFNALQNSKDAVCECGRVF